jgi:hypothetical protein
MTIVQDVTELGPVAQAAMVDPWVNYRLSVQTGMATTLFAANMLFDGTLIVPAVWETGIEPYQPRGRPELAVIEEIS